MSLDTPTALDWTARLAACGSLVAALEMLAVRHEFRTPGILSLHGAARFDRHYARKPESALLRIEVLLVGMALASATILVAGPFSLVGRIAVGLCLLTRGMVCWRRWLGGDGAEQMITITLAATLLAVLPWPSPTRVTLAVAFIAAQLVLSYVTAGVSKLISPVWRRGDALPGIVATESHGHPLAAALFRRYRLAATTLGWFVIVFECAFPAFLAGPPWLGLSALVFGLGFHIATAVLMGLNNFLWAFPATYPCVIIVARWVSPWW